MNVTPTLDSLVPPCLQPTVPPCLQLPAAQVVVNQEHNTLAHDLQGIVVQTIWSCFVGVCIGVGLGIFTR